MSTTEQQIIIESTLRQAINSVTSRSNRGTRSYYQNLLRTLRAHGISPRCSVDEAYRVGRERCARQIAVPQLTVRQRFERQLVERFSAEIANRGGEIGIDTERGTVELKLVDRRDRLVLLRAEGWRFYSRRFGSRPATLAYLCGDDDNGAWAVRVLGTTTSVDAALEWLTPAAVSTAILEGRRVLRQGDVYAVECRHDHAAEDAASLRGAHRWDETTRTLHHSPADERQHNPLAVHFPARLVQQRSFRMGRSGRRGSAD